MAFAVTDRYQNKGVGTELLAHLTQIARRQGLHGFTAEVLRENEAMLRVFEKMKFPLEIDDERGRVPAEDLAEVGISGQLSADHGRRTGTGTRDRADRGRGPDS